MQKILLFVFFGFTFTVFSQNLQEKYQHAQINYNNVDDLVRLSNLGIPVDHGIHKRGVFLISDFSNSSFLIINSSLLKVSFKSAFTLSQKALPCQLQQS